MCLARALEERARPLGCAIAFPEGEDPRVVEAAHTLARRGVARPVLIRRDSDGTGAGIDGDGLYTEVVPSGVDPLERAAGMLRRGEVDGVVAGAVHTSAQVIRTGLKYIGLRDDVGMLSSCFFMEVGPFRSSRPEVLVFADAGVVPQPDADVMAETARECARIRGVVVQDEPVIAFLSYSTLGSADGDAVERVRAARARLCQMAPDIRADGELQAGRGPHPWRRVDQGARLVGRGTREHPGLPQPGRRQHRLQAGPEVGGSARTGSHSLGTAVAAQ